MQMLSKQNIMIWYIVRELTQSSFLVRNSATVDLCLVRSSCKKIYDEMFYRKSET